MLPHLSIQIHTRMEKIQAILQEEQSLSREASHQIDWCQIEGSNPHAESQWKIKNDL